MSSGACSLVMAAKVGFLPYAFEELLGHSIALKISYNL